MDLSKFAWLEIDGRRVWLNAQAVEYLAVREDPDRPEKDGAPQGFVATLGLAGMEDGAHFFLRSESPAEAAAGIVRQLPITLVKIGSGSVNAWVNPEAIKLMAAANEKPDESGRHCLAVIFNNGGQFSLWCESGEEAGALAAETVLLLCAAAAIDAGVQPGPT